MITYTNECVGCPPELRCMGTSCPNRNVKHYICDKCKCEVEELYDYEGEELCLECIEDSLIRIE